MKLVALCLSGLPLMLHAQMKADSLPAKTWKNDIGISYGLDTRGSFSMTEADWNKLSGLTNPDTSFQFRQWGGQINSNIYVNIQMGVQLKPFSEKSKLSQMLRFSIGAGGRQSQYAQWEHVDHFAYDTLTSSQTGEQYYLDSISINTWQKSYESSECQISTQYLIQTDRERRISGYAGAGVGLGITRMSTVNVWQTQSTGVQTVEYLNDQDDDQHYYYQNNYSTLEMTTVNKATESHAGTLNANLQVPVGFDFRLSKKNNFASRTVIGAEATYMFLMHKIPEVRVVTGSQVRFGVHLRFRV